MSIKFVMLGFLSEQPMTGYDLKKKFSTSDLFYWSGNSNQVYRKLVELHEEGFVTIEVEYQESKPPRKIYTITAEGKNALREWVLATPELPQFRNALLNQLAWADGIDADSLSVMLSAYEEELQAHVALFREQIRRNQEARTAPSLRDRIEAYQLSQYTHELEWLQTLRQEVNDDTL